MKTKKTITNYDVDHGSIHQLDKLQQDTQERKKIYPVTVIDAVFDRHGVRLDQILSRNNNVYLKYLGTFKDTVLQVPLPNRHHGLLVTYNTLDGECRTERFMKDASFSDDAWSDHKNWHLWDYDSMYARIMHVVKKNMVESIKADKTLDEKIDQEIQDRKDADERLQAYIEKLIAEEKAERTAADERLQVYIEQEIANRIAADQRLRAYIESLISDEENARKDADSKLQVYIETLVKEESEARVAADQRLQVYITELVNSEEENRKSADVLLQNQIDNINTNITTIENRLNVVDTQISSITVDVANISANLSSLQEYTYAFKTDYDETKAKVENLIQQFDSFEIAEVVTELPTTDIKENIIYLVPSPNPDSGELDIYVEYVYVNNQWEKLGEKQMSVDLSGYVNAVEAVGTSPFVLTGSIDGNTLLLNSSYDSTALFNTIVGMGFITDVGVASITTSNGSAGSLANVLSISTVPTSGDVVISYSLNDTELTSYIKTVIDQSVDLTDFLTKTDASSTYQPILKHYSEVYSSSTDSSTTANRFELSTTYKGVDTIVTNRDVNNLGSGLNTIYETNYRGVGGSALYMYSVDTNKESQPMSSIFIGPDYIQFGIEHYFPNLATDANDIYDANYVTLDRNHLYVGGKQVVVEGDGVVTNIDWSEDYCPSATARLLTGNITSSSVVLSVPDEDMSATHSIHMIFKADVDTEVSFDGGYVITNDENVVSVSSDSYIEINLLSDGQTIYLKYSTI